MPRAEKTDAGGGKIGSVTVSSLESGDSAELTCLWKKDSRNLELNRSFSNMVEGMGDSKINRGIGLFATLRDLVLKGMDEEILGGNRFSFNSPSLAEPQLNDSIVQLQDGIGFVTLNANAAGSHDFVIWRDAEGRIIGNGKALSVPEAPGSARYFLSVTNDDGECVTAEIELASEAGIKGVEFDASLSRLIVGFNETPREGDSLNITGVTASAASNGSLQVELPPQERITIDGKSFLPGIYKVTYVRNGQQWSTSGFTVK